MKRTNSKRALIVSGSMILLCTAMIIGMTFALFTDRQDVTNHLQAGDLEITLDRVGLTKTTLNSQGYLVETVVQTDEHDPVPFSGGSKENVFGILNGEKIVPGSKFQATMRVQNNSDVAFKYWIEVVCGENVSQEAKDALAKQLKVTVNNGSDVIANGLSVGENDNWVITKDIPNNEAFFTVTVEFLDSFIAGNGLTYYENDNAKNQNLTFDLVVHAVQVTNATPSAP